MNRQGWAIALLGFSAILPTHAEVVITGLNAEMTAAVEAQLSLWTQPCDLHTRSLSYQFSRVEAEVRDALESFGFYTPLINSKLEWGEAQSAC